MCVTHVLRVSVSVSIGIVCGCVAAYVGLRALRATSGMHISMHGTLLSTCHNLLTSWMGQGVLLAMQSGRRVWVAYSKPVTLLQAVRVACRACTCILPRVRPKHTLLPLSQR